MKTPEDRIQSYLTASQLCCLLVVVKPLHAAIILILAEIIEGFMNRQEIKERRDARLAASQKNVANLS